MKQSRTTLTNQIAAQIRQSPLSGVYTDQDGIEKAASSITFCSYMEACLYDEQYGYYRSGPIRVGKEGDFYTSSAIGDVMGEVIAGYINAFSGELDDMPLLVEWGAGTGRLSAQIAGIWMRREAGRSRRELKSVLVEDHPGHAAAAIEAFAEQGAAASPIMLNSAQAFADPALWERPVLVLANELLDAFPVHRLTRRNGRLVELGVSGSAEKGFFYTYMPLSDARLERNMELDGISLSEGQLTEQSPGAAEWLGRLAESMKAGRVILIDYGHDAAEYAAEHRMEGTLMTYSRHRASDSPLLRPGEQDITAHVSFDQIRRAAEEALFEVVYYESQKQFLIDFGALELLRDHDGRDPFSAAARRNRAVRQLLLSDEMSETFKVMILEKKPSPRS